MAAPAPGADEADYSAAATTVHFDRPLALLRGPIPAGQNDDVSLGSHVLAFRNPQSFFSAYRFCNSRLLRQCESGVRIGCSVAATGKCGLPWWKLLLGATAADFRERERCEEREMAVCLGQSKGKCEGFAKEKSLAAFRRARVARGRRWEMGEKEAAELIGWISWSGVNNRNLGFMVSELGFRAGSNSLVYEVKNCRGSELLGDESE